MTPEQARWVVSQMSQEQVDGLLDAIRQVCDLVPRLDAAVTALGARLAEDAEHWANGATP